MKTGGKKWTALLLAAVMVLSLLPVGAMAEETPALENIALGKTVSVSSGTSESTVTDGKTTPGEGKQWASGNMKDSAALAENGGKQKPQWLMIDLGDSYEGKEVPVEYMKLWYNRMVWPE